jgi:beta-lactamase regulating signal transducer with metallopeptidase domain
MNPLLTGAIRASLVLGICWLGLYLTRGRSASLRRLVLVVALSGALIAPFASLVLPYARAAGFPALPLAIDPSPLLDLGPDGDFPGLPAFDTGSPSPDRAPSAAATASGSAWSDLGWSIAGIAWALGTSLFMMRLVIARAALGRLLRGAQPATADLQAVFRSARAAVSARAPLLISDSIAVPLTAGVLRSVIVLPSQAADWSEQRRSAVLRHELAHVRRHDGLAQLVAELACAVHFFNPLVWWARRRLEIERELAADELVIQSGLSASSYASELLNVASERLDAVPGAALGVVRRSELSERVERLVTTGARALPSRRERALALAISCALLALLACASATKSASPAVPGSSVSSPPGASAGDGLSDEIARALGVSASSLALTIEPRIQRVASEETARAIEASDAATATAIVIDPGSGRVLALTNPRTATKNYAPGSTLKTLMVAAALDEGKLTPDQSFDCGAGYRDYEAAGRLRDTAAHGVLSVAQILERSSNVGASRIYDLMGGADFAGWFNRFHLDEPLPIQLERAAGSAGALKDQPVGSLRGAIAAMGQGVATSPLHMAALYAAVANDGVYFAPTLVREQRGAGGNVIYRHEPKPEQLLRPETARTTLKLLIGSVEGRDATGRAARLEGVSVAGKTGSAQVVPIGPQVSEGDSPSYASFIGIVPASAPRYVILVGVEGKKTELTGGKVAAPAFARIASRILAAN